MKVIKIIMLQYEYIYNLGTQKYTGTLLTQNWLTKIKENEKFHVHSKKCLH